MVIIIGQRTKPFHGNARHTQLVWRREKV